MFIYENHMGGLYSSDLDDLDTYCETCGDSDWLLGEANTKEEAYELIKSTWIGDIYEEEYIMEFINGIDFKPS